MPLIHSHGTFCINYTSRMWTASFGVMNKIVGKFPGNTTYSDFPSLPPELAVDVTLPSGSEGKLGLIDGPSLGSVQFEFLLLLLMDPGVALLEVVVSVFIWAAWAYLELASICEDIG